MKNYLIFSFTLFFFFSSCECPTDPNDSDSHVEYEVTFLYPENQLEHIYDIEIEKDEIYVCGLYTGVHKFDNDFSLLDIEVNNRNRVFENITFHNSEIWVSTSDGLFFSNNNEERVYNSSNTELDYNNIFDLKFLSEDKALLASKSGLYIFNIRTEQLERIELADVSGHIDSPYNKSDGFPFRIHLSNNGDIWVGFMSGGLFQLRNGEWTHYNRENSALNSNAIRSIVEAKNGDIYIGQWRGGVCKFSEGESSKFDFTNSNEVLDWDRLDVWAMEFDKNDNLWIGTWGDVLLYDFWKKELSVFGNDEIGFKVRSLKKNVDGDILMGLESNGLVEIIIENVE